MRTKFILCVTVSLLLFSCQRDQKHWDTNILAPLFKAEMGFDDLLADSLMIVESDKSYSFSYDYIYAIDSVGHYLDVPDTLDKVKITLDKLVLADRTYLDTFTLREMDPTTGLFDGLTLPFDAQKISNPQGEQIIDVSEAFFQTAKFNKGFLDITIHNDLPVYVDKIVFKLANKASGIVVAQDTFVDIAPNSSSTKSIDLAGKVVDGVMVGSIVTVETRASNGPVLIDADKGVRLELSVHSLEPEYATAIFPAQTLVEENQEVLYNFGGPLITEIKARTGWVKMKISSTIQEEIIIDYSFPNSGENGDFKKPFKKQYRVPPAAPGTTQVIEGEFPLDGYVMQYKGKDPSQPPYFNTVYSELTARTVYSGKVRDLSLDDFVEIEFGLVDIKPEYAFGDFGRKEFVLDETLDIPIFKDVSGRIDLEAVKMNLFLDNAFGIQALTTVNSIIATNSKNNTSVALTHPWLIGTDVLLTRATNPPLIAHTQFYEFNQTTSNIKQFLEVLPDKITTNIKIISRPNGSRDYTDFVKDVSYLRARLTLVMPIQFAADNLTLVKKQAFNLNSLKNSDKIKSGTFKLRVENDFPLDAKIQVEFLTDADEALLILFNTGEKIDAARINSSTGKTDNAAISYLTSTVNAQQLDLIREAVKVRITTVFDTPNGTPNKIFSDYLLKTQLSADFVYEQTL